MIGKTSIGRSFKGCCGLQHAESGNGERGNLLSQGVRDFDQQAMVADFVRQAQMNPDLKPERVAHRYQLRPPGRSPATG